VHAHFAQVNNRKPDRFWSDVFFTTLRILAGWVSECRSRRKKCKFLQQKNLKFISETAIVFQSENVSPPASQARLFPGDDTGSPAKRGRIFCNKMCIPSTQACIFGNTTCIPLAQAWIVHNMTCILPTLVRPMLRILRKQLPQLQICHPMPSLTWKFLNVQVLLLNNKTQNRPDAEQIVKLVNPAFVNLNTLLSSCRSPLRC